MSCSADNGGSSTLRNVGKLLIDIPEDGTVHCSVAWEKQTGLGSTRFHISHITYISALHQLQRLGLFRLFVRLTCMMILEGFEKYHQLGYLELQSGTSCTQVRCVIPESTCSVEMPSHQNTWTSCSGWQSCYMCRKSNDEILTTRSAIKSEMSVVFLRHYTRIYRSNTSN